MISIESRSKVTKLAMATLFTVNLLIFLYIQFKHSYQKLRNYFINICEVFST